MGGADKAFVLFHGKHLLVHAIGRLQPQVAAMAVNSNHEAALFDSFGAPVVADPLPGYLGPLAGILAGMRFAESAGMAQIASVAVDAPLFPSDLVARLAEAGGDSTVAVARSGGRLHPVFGLFPVGLAADLAAFIARSESLKVTDWLSRHVVVPVDFAAPDPGQLDPFFNINTPADLAKAEESPLVLPQP